MSRRRGDRFLVLCWPLYDVHEARAAPDMPPQLRARLRALYAATEAYVCAEVAAEHRPHGLGRVVLAAVRLGWVAGIIVGRLSVLTASEPHRGPVGSDVVDPFGARGQD